MGSTGERSGAHADIPPAIPGKSGNCASQPTLQHHRLWRCGSVVYDIDGIYLLLAATVRRAQFDAKRGDKAAKRWLKGFLAGVKC